MKYCIRYTNDFRLYDLVDEIKIKLWEVDMNLLGYTQKIKQEKLKQRVIATNARNTKMFRRFNLSIRLSDFLSRTFRSPLLPYNRFRLPQ